MQIIMIKCIQKHNYLCGFLVIILGLLMEPTL